MFVYMYVLGDVTNARADAAGQVGELVDGRRCGCAHMLMKSNGHAGLVERNRSTKETKQTHHVTNDVAVGGWRPTTRPIGCR